MISKLISQEKVIIIVSIEALLDKIIIKDIFQKHTETIELENDINLDLLIKNFVNSGYERVHMVEGVGQFSIRGGIIDFFPPNSNNPYRVELFDEEVDSIRTFDILTQRSLETKDKITIPPVKEILITEEISGKTIQNLKGELEKFNFNERTEEKFSRYIELLEENIYLSNRDMILPYIPKEYLGSIIDYLQEDSLIFIDEPKRVEEKYKNNKEDFYIKIKDLLEAGEVMPSHLDMAYEYEEILPNILQNTS